MILKQKSILASLFIASFLIIIVTSGYCADNRLTSVNDVDSFDVIAYKKTNTTLYVSFLYKNHKTDQLVFLHLVFYSIAIHGFQSCFIRLDTDILQDFFAQFIISESIRIIPVKVMQEFNAEQFGIIRNYHC